MILSRTDLRRETQAGHIEFDPPLEEKQWGEASVDLRLGHSFTILTPVPGIKVSVAEGLKALGEAGFWRTKILRDRDEFGNPETFSLVPGQFVLGFTHERITVPRNMIARVEGRSTYARLGLSMHQTAPWIQPGWTNTAIVLEIMNNGPLTIELTPLKDRPCQLTFFQLSSELPPTLVYGARGSDVYAGQEHPLVRPPSVES